MRKASDSLLKKRSSWVRGLLKGGCRGGIISKYPPIPLRV
ncbi:hypothetical protein HPHPP25_1017 [Helicobacter pylori Hp P-25]|nr:hypothetical protein HPHPP25_1017 [Helicobacter pylori Hp P-25]